MKKQLSKTLIRNNLRLALAVALAMSMPRMAAFADGHHAYQFTKIATLGVSPNFGDFEVGQLNNHGQVIFVSETSTCIDTGFGFPVCEGAFLQHAGRLSQIIYNDAAAPGGATFGGAFSGPTAINDSGDGIAAVVLTPFSFPFGINAGLFRYSDASGTLSALVLPGVTPAPGSAGLTFQGMGQGISINRLGEIAFPGAIPSSAGVPGTSVGVGIYKADRRGHISTVMMPGDPAPNGSTFDYCQNAWINDRGDVAFEAHLAGAECIGNPDHSFVIGCYATGVYLRPAHTGHITKIAQQGDRDSFGTPFRHAWGPVINNSGQVLFVGDLTPPPDNDLSLGLYLYDGSSVASVVRPGDTMPGGGTFRSSGLSTRSFDLNQCGDICYSGTLVNGDQGVYIQHGAAVTPRTELVIKTGASMPGIGTFSAIVGGFSGPVINDRDQLVFAATLTNGDTVLVMATPARDADDED